MRKTKKTKKDLVKKSLHLSILDGSFYAGMVGFGESFFSAFAVFLKATPFQLGILGSLPQTIGSLSQLFTNKLLRLFKTRKRMVITLGLLQALMHIPIMLVIWLGTFTLPWLIFFVSLYFLFSMLISPVWSSWMGDLVDEKERGSYFGKRNRITGYVTFISFVLAGYLLESFSTTKQSEYLGFMGVFFFAIVARGISLTYLYQQYEPKYTLSKKYEFSFIEFLQQARFRNYGLFVIYLCCMNFAVYIAAPFFTPFLLRGLDFNYWTFTIITSIAVIVKFLVMPAWGWAADIYGNKKVLAVSGFIMPFVPLVWILNTDFWYLVLVQIFSGFIWAGFELASFNFIFDTTTPQKRTTCISYFNVLNGAAVLGGAMLGSAIIKFPPSHWSPYYAVFLVSFLLRFLSTIVFLPKIHEVRTVKKITEKRLLLKVLSTLPYTGSLQHHVHHHASRKILIPRKPRM